MNEVRETTGFSDADGNELFLGDVVRVGTEEPFRSIGHHGDWVEYEITKAAGGYILSYVRSEKGCVLPFGYTSAFMNQFHADDLPDLKMLLWSSKPIRHPYLKKIEDKSTPQERRELFMIESNQRRAALSQSAQPKQENEE